MYFFNLYKYSHSDFCFTTKELNTIALMPFKKLLFQNACQKPVFRWRTTQFCYLSLHLGQKFPLIHDVVTWWSCSHLPRDDHFWNTLLISSLNPSLAFQHVHPSFYPDASLKKWISMCCVRIAASRNEYTHFVL